MKNINKYRVISEKDYQWHGKVFYVLDGIGNPENTLRRKGNFILAEVGNPDNMVPIHQGEIAMIK